MIKAELELFREQLGQAFPDADPVLSLEGERALLAEVDQLRSDASWLFSEFGWDHWRECDVPKDEDGGCPHCAALEEMKDHHGW